jgi:transcriptional regulator with XRE-family HTH domain
MSVDRHPLPMATRQRPGDGGAAAARRQAAEAGREVRDTRIGLAMSIAMAARRAGMSASQYARIERGLLRRPTCEQIWRAAAAVGLEPSLRLYPASAPVRDRGQLPALGRFEGMLGNPLALRREVGLPIPGDRRAWDGRITGGERPASVECEVRLHDVQAVTRRVELKTRDDPGSGVIILVIARSAHNRRVLAEHREALRLQFPLDGAAITRELRAGRVPKASGIIMV